MTRQIFLFNGVRDRISTGNYKYEIILLMNIFGIIAIKTTKCTK
jgi:hypothetical protein